MRNKEENNQEKIEVKINTPATQTADNLMLPLRIEEVLDEGKDKKKKKKTKQNKTKQKENKKGECNEKKWIKTVVCDYAFVRRRRLGQTHQVKHSLMSVFMKG